MALMPQKRISGSGHHSSTDATGTAGLLLEKVVRMIGA